MSRVLSFSTDNDFAKLLDDLIEDSGYKNRSMFLRDASMYFAEVTQKGDLSTMKNNDKIEGTLVIYYQHGVESKLTELRHSHSLSVSSYQHNCLTESHTCVDTMQINGKVGSLKEVVSSLRNTQDIDRVVFVSAPMRGDGCC
jgi:CopG family nickel-responsive transcriptional regulator